jgi:hypothetical protein
VTQYGKSIGDPAPAPTSVAAVERPAWSPLDRVIQQIGPSRKLKAVLVTVSWGNDCVEVTLRLTRTEWDNITRGHRFIKDGRGYRYEGARFHDTWRFNYDHPGSLEVDYDDGGQGFIGDLDEAHIETTS